MQVNILKKISEVYSFACFRFSFSTVEVVMDEIAVAWEDVGKKTLFVLPSHKMDCCHKLCDHGCLLSILGEHSLQFKGYYNNYTAEISRE